MFWKNFHVNLLKFAAQFTFQCQSKLLCSVFPLKLLLFRFLFPACYKIFVAQRQPNTLNVKSNVVYFGKFSFGVLLPLRAKMFNFFHAQNMFGSRVMLGFQIIIIHQIGCFPLHVLFEFWILFYFTFIIIIILVRTRKVKPHFS